MRPALRAIRTGTPIGVTVKTAESLLEEAVRVRRLAHQCTDKKLQADLEAYALELEDRAARMEAAMNPERKSGGSSG
jgi:hypothetical protein